MYLTLEEKDILNGSQGEAAKLAMETLVKIGEINGAERFIPIKNVHLVLHAYKSAFDAGVEIAEKIADMGGRFIVPVTIDPYGMDAEDWKEAKTPEDYAKKQMRLETAVMKMGVIPNWTCTPYYGFTAPRKGEHLAWSESSAVAYANTACGARTNRQTAIVDIFCGIVGRAPLMGLHIDKNRKGEVLIKLKVDRPLVNWEYPALGYLLGQKLGSRIGVIEGMRGNPKSEDLKNFCGAAAAAGSVALIHIVGITPEADSTEDVFDSCIHNEVIEITEEDIRDMRKSMCSNTTDRVDFVALGCPHYTINEIVNVHKILDGRKIHSNTAFWIYANSYALRLAEKMNIRQELENLGIKFRAETCMIISPIKSWGFQTMMTDSGKCSYYGPAECGTEMIFASVEECVESAVSGKLEIFK
jgi:predicted aconitase